MMMKTNLICTAIIFFFLAIKGSKADDFKLVVQKACSGAPHNTLCIESLNSAAGKSVSTDLGGVLCVAVNAVYKNLTDTQAYAKKIHATMKSGFMSQTVFDCSNSYTDAVLYTEKALTVCEKKSYGEVKGNLLAAMADPKICEDKFTLVPGTVSPLKSRNEVLLQLYGNAIAINDLVNGIKR
ncbi:putative invertase inhibitor [Impatiens glandulifera]|uniref:putative invertase inhibitor n=1 Tax=Impatiens glandulifera TaxID=253017 RepID=UPI001FB146F8|nr:putative invertase inhibitor [Impatiens glandulifera]